MTARPGMQCTKSSRCVCGFGGMHQGMAALGYRPVVAVDSNERMLKLYGNQCEATQVLGDVNDLSTLQKVWKAGKGAGTLAAGFACQPFFSPR